MADFKPEHGTVMGFLYSKMITNDELPELDTISPLNSRFELPNQVSARLHQEFVAIHAVQNPLRTTTLFAQREF